MTFKHKLSCRLALMKDALLLLASVVTLVSCEVPAAGLSDPLHSDPLPQVVRVIVTPESLSLDPAQHMKFAAYGRTTSGDSSAVVVSWHATGGNISSDGTFAADTTAGDFLVSGTSAALNLSATARVHIRPRPVAAPRDSIFGDNFESGNLAAWQDGVDPARHRVVTDPLLAHSGSRFLEITYPADGDGGYLTRFFMPGYDSAYVSYYIKFDASWTGMTKLIGLYGSRIDNQWSSFGRAGQCPNGTDFLVAILTTETGTGDPGNVRFYSYYPDMSRESDGTTCWGRYGDGSETYVPPLNLSRNVWHHIEFWAKLNTPGQNNAAQKFWVDGVLRGSWSGFRFRNTTDLMLNAFMITASSAKVSTARRIYIDDVVVLPATPGR